MGFFNQEQISQIIPNQSNCLQCGLYKDCIHPIMKPTGKGEKGIFFLAEAPGKLEDEQGTQLVGKAGKFLRRILDSFGIDLDRDCRKMNAVNCRPLKNRTPSSQEINFCRGMVLEEIKRFKPRLIILLGGPAVQSIIGHRWKKNLDGITKWRGWTIPDRDFGCWICPTFHPSYVQREEKNPVVELIFEQDLERALNMLFIPFPIFLPLDTGLRLITEVKPTIEYLKRIKSEQPELIAFDFETTGLKPHKKGHEIVSCSIAKSDNISTAFLLHDNPWIKLLLGKILSNPNIKKIGANIKFEHNWAKEKLGIEITGWVHDICLVQHMSDNRSGICSVKFMAYIYEGIVNYDSHIEPFLNSHSKSGNAFNQIRKISIKDLLKYNAIDSKVEFSIAKKQMERFL